MDVNAIVEIIRGRDLVPFVVLAVAAAVPLARGLFSVKVERKQRRKEFLELWRDADLGEKSDLWVEEVVQHRYGAFIPARLIRHVEQLECPSRKLGKLAMTAGFFDLDPPRVVWEKRWRQSDKLFIAEALACCLGYFVLAPIGVGLVLAGWRLAALEYVAPVLLGALITGVAGAAFFHLLTLIEARSTIRLLNAPDHPGHRRKLKSLRRVDEGTRTAEASGLGFADPVASRTGGNAGPSAGVERAMVRSLIAP